MNKKDLNAIDDRNAVRRRAAASEDAAAANASGMVQDDINAMSGFGAVVALGLKNHKNMIYGLQKKLGDSGERIDVLEREKAALDRKMKVEVTALKDVTAVAVASKRVTDLLIAELSAATGESVEALTERMNKTKNREYHRVVDDWICTGEINEDPRLKPDGFTTNRSWYSPTP